MQKIQEHARLLEERLETYQAIDAMIRSYPDSNDAVYWLLTLDYGIRKTRALSIGVTLRLRPLKEEIDMKRIIATPNKDVVVFIIGLRINRLRSIRHGGCRRSRRWDRCYKSVMKTMSV